MIGKTSGQHRAARTFRQVLLAASRYQRQSILCRLGLLFDEQPKWEAEQLDLCYRISRRRLWLPGQLRVETLLAVVSGSSGSSDSDLGKSAGKLLIRYRAALSSSGSVEATPLNLTHHWGFNLSSSNEKAYATEKGTVSDHVVEMYPPAGKSLYQLDLDSSMIATGKLNLSSGSADSFSNPGSHHWDKQGGKRVSEDIPSAGYDDFYVWGLDEAVPQCDKIDAIATESTKRMRVTSESSWSIAYVLHKPSRNAIVHCRGAAEHPADPAKSGGLMKKAHRKGGLPRVATSRGATLRSNLVVLTVGSCSKDWQRLVEGRRFWRRDRCMIVGWCARLGGSNGGQPEADRMTMLARYSTFSHCKSK